MNSYFQLVKPCYIENWPTGLYGLSLAQADVPLSIEEATNLGLSIAEYGENFVPLTREQKRMEAAQNNWAKNAFLHSLGNALAPGPKPDYTPPPVPKVDLNPLRERILEAVRRFPKGAFLRLGSRSPKDSWAWNSNPCPIQDDGQDPLRFFLDCSERTNDDLKLALDNNYAPHIWVRQWMEIEDHQEFRCFLKKKRLVGVSQYTKRAYFPEIEEHQSELIWAIKCFADLVRKEVHLDDVVFDVVARVRRKGNETDTNVILLEINPSCEMTDPCLFKWAGGDFDGTFRYVNKEGGMTTIPIR